MKEEERKNIRKNKIPFRAVHANVLKPQIKKIYVRNSNVCFKIFPVYVISLL